MQEEENYIEDFRVPDVKIHGGRLAVLLLLEGTRAIRAFSRSLIMYLSTSTDREMPGITSQGPGHGSDRSDVKMSGRWSA